MRITKHTDYAIRSLMYLSLKDEEDLASIREISEFFNISKNHLMKVINRLSQDGYITSARGKHGGIKLAKSPNAIELGELLRKLELDGPMVDCDTGPCQFLGNCTLKCRLDAAKSAFANTFNGVTIADLAADRSALQALIH